jgi:hypothetical protein
MDGVILGFEIAAGILLFIVALFLLIALPLWSLRAAVWLVETLTKELKAAFNRQRFIHALIGLGAFGALIIIASMLGR